MHPLETRTEFLRLRASGLSLGSISRRLGVSKPTLIAWNRDAQPQLQAAMLAEQQQRDAALANSTNQELADLKRRLGAVRQELFSRDMSEFSTPTLEQLAGQLTARIQQIESVTPADLPLPR